MHRSRSVLVTASLCLLLVACQAPMGEPSVASPLVVESFSLVEGGSVTIPWGAASEGLGLRPPQEEQAAGGPQAVTLTPSGAVAVLDGLQGRVALFDGEGSSLGSMPAPSMAADLAFFDDGSYATVDLVSLQATRYSAQGELLSTEKLSAAFVTTVGAVTHGQTLSLVTRYQETYTLGGPQPLASRQGGILGQDGVARVVSLDKVTGVVTLGEVLVPLLKGGRDKKLVTGAVALDCDAVALVGATTSGVLAIACDRVDDGAGTGPLEVTRTIALVTPTGAVVDTIPVAIDGPYLPFRPYRVVGDTLIIAEPTDMGLAIHWVEVRGEVTP